MKKAKSTGSCYCPTCGKPSTLYGMTTKPLKEDEAYRKRIRNLIVQFELEGYTTYERDLSVACAVAQIMSVGGESDHMQQILSHHTERIIAGSLMEAI